MSPRWIDDPIVVLGHDGEPVMGAVLAHGRMVPLLYDDAQPSKATASVPKRIRGSRFGAVRVRMFYAFAGRELWVSPGIYEWRRLEWIALWFRAMRRNLRGRIPRARVVSTGAKRGQGR